MHSEVMDLVLYCIGVAKLKLILIGGRINKAQYTALNPIGSHD